MKLPPEQVARFYRIWFPLLNYVNAHRQLLPSFPMAPGEDPIAPADRIAARRMSQHLNPSGSVSARYLLASALVSR